MAPRVSVLVPAYNAERYVEASVGSVFAQTFTDWELVAVDDASTDGTHELLRSHPDPRVRVHRNEQNLGMTPNWNRALSLATGELVLKLDADDVLRPRALELLVSALDDPKVIAAGIRSMQCDESLEPFDGIQGDDAMLRAGIDPYGDAVHDAAKWYDIAAHGHQLWSSSALMIRRGALDAIEGWDARFGCASDTELILRILEQEQPVAHRGEVGLYYRVRKGSISDEYRSRGWLTWESLASNLVSLTRMRRKRPLRRSLRMHFVRLWNRWQTWDRSLPPNMCTAIESVMSEVEPPPLADRIMTRVRDGVSAA
jgi:glycosyltransferase involved in cell wall biosynthesis